MAKIFAVSMLTASLSLLLIPSADAFGVKSALGKVDTTDFVDLSYSIPFLSSILDAQNSAEAASNATASLADQVLEPVISAATSALNESFNDISTLSANGWAFKNNSSPPQVRRPAQQTGQKAIPASCLVQVAQLTPHIFTLQEQQAQTGLSS